MRLFRRRKAPIPVSPGDMRSTPVNNPLDWREDGSIRKGDPAWDAMWRMMKTGEAMIANQKPDGTWDVKFFPKDSQ